MKDKNNAERSDKLKPLVLHLVLTHHWYEEIIAGRKWCEYRKLCPHWKRLIEDRADRITHVRFQRGFKKNPPKITFEVECIDIGDCPYDGWDDEYYRVFFK